MIVGLILAESPDNRRIVAEVHPRGLCPYISEQDTDILREFMREDIVRDNLEVQLRYVLNATSHLVNYSKFCESQLAQKWEDASRKPRTFPRVLRQIILLFPTLLNSVCTSLFGIEWWQNPVVLESEFGYFYAWDSCAG